jgi:SAM-dependent methyltransferase
MKLAVVGENLLEKIVVALGVAPITLVDTHVAFMRARAIMVAAKCGIFDALRERPLSAYEVASKCGTAPIATEKILNALVASDYIAYRNGAYALTGIARKWITRDSPTSLRDKLLFEFVEWEMVEHFDDFVRTGRPLDMHRSDSEEHWALYQRAMRALSGVGAPEIVRRTPVPPGATAMLDIGGSHGFISVAMCRRYPQLRAVVLDLPAAVKHAASILAAEGMDDRVTHRTGNALEDDLGTEQWDVVYVSQLVHHFDEATNRQFVRRIARALKPRGVFVILELLRPSSPRDAGQAGALLDLYFALTSRSGTWSVEEMAGWQRDAGLVPRKPIHMRTIPGFAEVLATKS